MITDQIGLHSVLLPLLIDIIYRFGQAKKRSSHFFFPHVSRAQHLTLASTRTRVIQLRAQCTDHWTTGQSCGVGMPMVQLTTHVKSSTLYGCTVVRSYGHTVVQLYCHTSKFFRLDGFLLFCIIMGLSYAFGNVSVKQGCHGSIFSSMRN